MPNVNPGESRQDFVSRCIPAVLDEGTAKDQSQAAAICFQMWRDRAKTLEMRVTKVQRLQNGRTRWTARANTGEFDLLQERFDEAFFDDVIANFYKVQEALSRGAQPPDGMTEPILDISHYSIYLPEHKRDLARAGWPNKMWRDGRALFAQGFFDDTRLGHLAAKAAIEREPQDRRVSVVVYPDYDRVEIEAGGRKVYRGGSGKAWLDSLGMTSTPCDPGAMMEVKSDMTTIADDAKKVLGDDSGDVIATLEAARTSKALPDGALVKATDGDDDQEDSEMETKTDQEKMPTTEETPTPAPSLTIGDVIAALDERLPGIAAAIDERFEPLKNKVAELIQRADALEAQIKALGATEAEKVQKAIDGESLFAKMWPDEDKLSVQRSAPTVTDKEIKTPSEAAPEEGRVYEAFFGK